MTDANRRIRLCMIGAGDHSSRNIYPYFHRLADEACVVANCDLEEARARRVAGLFGIERSYTDYHEMLERERPDGVLVCVGDRFHAEAAIDLMQADFHVYVEKPHAPSLEKSRQMLETARRTGKICMAAYKKRFAPAYRKAREVIRSEGFGRPTALTFWRSQGGAGTREDPAYLWQWGCHGTDLISFLFGPVDRVHVFRTAGSWTGTSVNLQFVNGSVGQMILAKPGGSWEELVASGEGGEGLTVTNATVMTRYRGDEPTGGHHPSYIHGYHSSAVEMGYVGELQEFVAAIREGRQPEGHIAQATHTAALHEAMMQSAESGRVVEVEQFDAADLGQPAASAPVEAA